MILISQYRYEELPLATASGGLEPLPTGGQWVRDGNTVLTLRAKVLFFGMKANYDDWDDFMMMIMVLANFPTTIFQRLSWSAADCTIYEGDETGGKVDSSLTNIIWSPWLSYSASSSQSPGAVQDRSQRLTRSSSFRREWGRNPNRLPQENALYAPGICSGCLWLLR